MDSASRRGMGRLGGVLFSALLLGMCLAGAAAPPQNVGRVSTPLLSQQARLQPADLAGGDGDFSHGVLSADGRTALLPARFQDCAAGPDCGAVYVFALEQGVWTLQAKLTLPGAAANDQFGEAALSADGNVALIGAAPRDCGLGPFCGEAYVFERSGGVWSGGVKLASPSPEKGAYYGLSVALSGDARVAVVGAVGQNCPSSVAACGAAFVFRRTGGTWSPEATLSFPGSQFFGSAIQISRDGTIVMLAGDTGVLASTIDVFRKTGGTWELEKRILPPGPLLDFEPAALSGDGQTAVIAAVPLGGIAPPTPQGLEYYVYVRNDGDWTQQGPVLPTPDGSVFADLSFDGNTAILGLQSGGKAQLFGRSGGTWSLLQELTPAEPGAAGSASWVALSDDARTALVGLPGVDCVGFLCREAGFIFAAPGFSPDVPTLSELGLALLVLLVAGTGAVLLRRRRVA
jgi:FG-GAP repeat protein/exosortase sorting signal-containing protein